MRETLWSITWGGATTRAHYLAELLARPDEPGLRRRGHVLTYAGDPKRRQTVLLPLLIRWAQYRCLAVDPEPWLAPAKPARERLRRVG